MATQELLKIVYALDIKFWVRWCTCSMWRMLLPCGKLIGLLLFCLLFLISILFLKPNVSTLNTFKDRARSPCNGNHFSSSYTMVVRDYR